MKIQAKLLSFFFRVFVIPFGMFFTLWLIIFIAFRLINIPEAPLTKDVVNFFVFGSAVLAMLFASAFAISKTVVVLLFRAPLPKKALLKRISKATAYNVKQISKSAAITTLILSVVFVIITSKTLELFYSLIWVILMIISILLVTVSEGIMDEKNEASFLLQSFSEKIEKRAKSNDSYLLSSRDFRKAFNTFDKILPRAVYTAYLEKRITQIELLLCFGNENDLSTLSKNIQSVAQSFERNHLEGFDKEYLNLANYLDKFVESKKGVVDFVEKIPLKEKLEKESGAILKEILVKTVPILIGILISAMIYLWLGFPIRLPSGT